MPAAAGGLVWLAGASACLILVELFALVAGVAARGLPVKRFAACVWRSKLAGTGVAAGEETELAAGVLSSATDTAAAAAASVGAGAAAELDGGPAGVAAP